MIALRTPPALIITPPKCAASALHVYFCEHPGPERGLWLHAVNAAGRMDKHHAQVPEDFAEFPRFLVVRDPKDRAVSLYHHLCAWRAFNSQAAPSFGAFARQLAAREPFADGYMFAATIRELVGLTRYDHLLRLETLETHLQEHGLAIPRRQLPRVNESYRRPTRTYYDKHPGALAAVAQWAADDFEQFDYLADF